MAGLIAYGTAGIVSAGRTPMGTAKPDEHDWSPPAARHSPGGQTRTGHRCGHHGPFGKRFLDDSERAVVSRAERCLDSPPPAAGRSGPGWQGLAAAGRGSVSFSQVDGAASGWRARLAPSSAGFTFAPSVNGRVRSGRMERPAVSDHLARCGAAGQPPAVQLRVWGCRGRRPTRRRAEAPRIR